MPDSSFQSRPLGLTSTQRREWDQRCQTAERILDQHAVISPRADAEVMAHLQPYVRGEITLGQAIGRLLDYQARR